VAWGTFNRLAFLGDTYLELIGVFDEALVASAGSAVGTATLAVLDAGGEGLATFAVATDDITGDVRRLRDAGSPIREPVDGSRARPDGEVVRWRTAAAALGPCEPPFLIEHESTGAEWGVEARAARASYEHPVAGPARLMRLEVPCADPSAVADAYGSTVGVAFEAAGDRGLEARFGPQVVRLAADPGDRPVIDLAGDWPEPRDVVRLGIRWRCEP
jgi:hypothetical protein